MGAAPLALMSALACMLAGACGASAMREGAPLVVVVVAAPAADEADREDRSRESAAAPSDDSVITAEPIGAAQTEGAYGDAAHLDPYRALYSPAASPNASGRAFGPEVAPDKIGIPPHIQVPIWPADRRKTATPSRSSVAGTPAPGATPPPDPRVASCKKNGCYAPNCLEKLGAPSKNLCDDQGRGVDGSVVCGRGDPLCSCNVVEFCRPAPP